MATKKKSTAKEDPEYLQFLKENKGGTKAREAREEKKYLASPQGAELKQWYKEEAARKNSGKKKIASQKENSSRKVKGNKKKVKSSKIISTKR